MLEFTVQDMTCGHCVSTITKAIRDAAPAAKVEIDLAARRVKVEGDVAAEAADIEEAIREAGYTPLPAATH